MWDTYYKNAFLRGIGHSYAKPDIVKKYSKCDPVEFKKLTNRQIVKLCDHFLVRVTGV